MNPRKPSDLQSHIDTHAIAARLVTDLGDTPTVPAAAEALGVETDQIIKTLLFLVEKADLAGNKTTEPVVVISNGESRVDKRPLADHFGVGKKRIKLAPADVVLDLLGYPAGGVPPFGHRTALPVILDKTILALNERYAGLIFAGGGDDRTMMALTVAELVRLTQPTVLHVSEPG